MSSVSTLLYYSEPLEPGGRCDDWLIDTISQPPKVLYNFRKVPCRSTIIDLRDNAIRPVLDEMGFERLLSPMRVDQVALSDGSEQALGQYQRETGALLRSFTGADEVVFFDSTLRRAGAASDAPNQSPHLRVHVDQNPVSARARATTHSEAPRRFRRFQIVNVWRPLVAPVRNFPLALCDYRSIDPTIDLVTTRLHFPEWLKDLENYSVRFNADHRWYYWEALSPDEVLVFKCFDSASRSLANTSESMERGPFLEVAGLCPHTAFFDPDGPTTGHLRTSIELRVLLFYV